MGEPASIKDRWLMRKRPHLVLDGLMRASAAVIAPTTAFESLRPSALAVFTMSPLTFVAVDGAGMGVAPGLGVEPGVGVGVIVGVAFPDAVPGQPAPVFQAASLKVLSTMSYDVIKVVSDGLR